jgi:hypothetical protein
MESIVARGALGRCASAFVSFLRWSISHRLLLSRCSMLHIDRNAQAYLAVSVRPSRKESPMQVKTAIIANAGAGLFGPVT